MIESTMPDQFWKEFRPDHPFPAPISESADTELNQLASILEREGIRVYRPRSVNWCEIGGYTGAMPRDGFLTVGNHIIESAFA